MWRRTRRFPGQDIPASRLSTSPRTSCHSSRARRKRCGGRRRRSSGQCPTAACRVPSTCGRTAPGSGCATVILRPSRFLSRMMSPQAKSCDSSHRSAVNRTFSSCRRPRGSRSSFARNRIDRSHCSTSWPANLRGRAEWLEPSAGFVSWAASSASSSSRTTRFAAARVGACSTRSSHTGEVTLTEPWKVAKFGGNCVSTVDMYERIAHLVEEDLSRKFLVVSAISGVTDSLVTILAQPREEKEIDPYLAELRRKHLGLLPKSREGPAGTGEAIDALVTKLERLLYGVAYTEEITPRTRDFVLSFGERLAAQVVAANLCQVGIDAAPHEADAIGLITDDTYGNATALLDETRARLAPFLRREAQAGRVSVITGFFGLSREGKTGTRIGPDTVDRSGDVKSISYVRDLATLKVFATGAGQKEGLLSQVATALTSTGTNVYSAATSQTCIALLVDADALSRAKKAVARLPFGLVERIEVLPHVSLISFVGEGLGYAHGVAARVFRAVAESGINVQLISAGASMVAYTFTVDNEDLERAVQAVHREFFGHRYLRPEVPAGSQRQG